VLPDTQSFTRVQQASSAALVVHAYPSHCLVRTFSPASSPQHPVASAAPPMFHLPENPHVVHARILSSTS
jgi:hypothetical protein